MTPRTLYLGYLQDGANDVNALSSSELDGDRPDGDAERASRVRAVVRMLDLDSCQTRREAKTRVSDNLADAISIAAQNAAIRHVILVVRVRARLSRYLHRAASSRAVAAVTRMEREGRRVEVTVLDASSCTDPLALLGCLRERARESIGALGAVMVNWDDVTRVGISGAAREQYL